MLLLVKLGSTVKLIILFTDPAPVNFLLLNLKASEDVKVMSFEESTDLRFDLASF